MNAYRMFIFIFAIAHGRFLSATVLSIPADRRFLTCSVGPIRDAGPGRGAIREVSFRFYDNQAATVITPSVAATVMDGQNKTFVAIHTPIVDELGAPAVHDGPRKLELNGDTETVHVVAHEDAVYWALLNEEKHPVAQFTAEVNHQDADRATVMTLASQ